MHTHFTRLPHQRVAKKVPPPPLLGRWLLMLGVLLITWGLVPQVVRANTDPKDIAKQIALDDIAMSEARPYIEFHYIDYDKDNSKPDAMRRIKIYVREFVGIQNFQFGNRYIPVRSYKDVLVGEMPRCHDKLVRHNEAYGRLTIVKDVMNGKSVLSTPAFTLQRNCSRVMEHLKALASWVASRLRAVGTTTTMATTLTT